MFSFLRNLFRRPEPTGIFTYFDGCRTRYADPIDIIRKLEDHHEFNPDRHLKAIEFNDPEAMDIAIRATRDVFGLKKWTEQNRKALPEMQVLDLLAEFYVWTEELKKNIEHSATPQPSSEPTSQNSSDETTNDSSPSTSDATERTTV